MTDLLVKLYNLPAVPACACDIRPALAPERAQVVGWVEEQFGSGWASEVAVAFGSQPLRCLVAVEAGELRGFACYNTTFQGFFGPFGVHPEVRGGGIGTALLIQTLDVMRGQGFAYAVIGATKSEAYYERVLGAIPIPDSWPGAYEGILPRPK